jgi:hypothetical protein
LDLPFYFFIKIIKNKRRKTMPYISKQDRQKYETIDKAISLTPEITRKGDLEYLVFKLMVKFMATREKRYSTLHDTVYAVAHASDEYRRRYLDNRENEAIILNGDIE